MVAVPGRAALRFVQREDARWRTVERLPADAVAQQGDPGRAFAGAEPLPGEFGMADWLAALETQRDAVQRALVSLLHDFDLERAFSHDPFDPPTTRTSPRARTPRCRS